MSPAGAWASPSTLAKGSDAGRGFAPSAGNSQPWKFIVVTDKALINEMNEGIYGALSMFYNMYKDDEMVKLLAAGYEASSAPGTFDPRIIVSGMGAVAKRNLPVLLTGICGQNRNLVANSLGIKSCWVGFAQVINNQRSPVALNLRPVLPASSSALRHREQTGNTARRQDAASSGSPEHAVKAWSAVGLRPQKVQAGIP